MKGDEWAWFLSFSFYSEACIQLEDNEKRYTRYIRLIHRRLEA